MCGIGGIFKKNNHPVDSAAIEKMRAALSARGPDGSGIYKNNIIALAHTRLSIIDIETGAQPLIDDKGCVIVFNGEIYNYIELRNELSTSYNFKTKSDTETLLALYNKYGPDFTSYLRGMYAFALYDPAFGRLVIARDPFGIKPFYIYETDEMLSFASEPKALQVLSDKNFDIDMSVLRQVLKDNYTRGAQTPYTQIARMAQGETRVYEGGKLIQKYHLEPVSRSAPRKITSIDTIKELGTILDNTVNLHTRSDVGYGIFLSGGVDSSVIAALLGRQKNRPRSINGYTAYFDMSRADEECHYADEVSEKTGIKPHRILFDKSDFDTVLPKIALYMDDPVSDYAVLPTWKLAAVARENEKVILSGEGGDEAFGGYGRYRTRWWKKKSKNIFDDKNASPDWTQLQTKQAKDIYGLLPNSLLIKLDNCLMAHGLEGRTPLLDRTILDFAFTLPDKLKIHGKHGKYILKKWLEKELPEADPFRKKQGFTVPVGSWIIQDAPVLSELLAKNQLVKDLLTKDEATALLGDMKTEHGAKQCWSILYMALWHVAREKKSVGRTIIETLG